MSYGIEMLDVEDVASILGMTPYTIRKYARSGLIVGKRFGRRWKFTRQTVENFCHKATNAIHSRRERKASSSMPGPFRNGTSSTETDRPANLSTRPK